MDAPLATSTGKWARRSLLALVPLGYAAYAAWIFASGTHTYRLGRSAKVITLAPPDTYVAGYFFVCLAVVMAGYVIGGSLQRRLTWTGLMGAAVALVVLWGRQLFDLAHLTAITLR